MGQIQIKIVLKSDNNLMICVGGCCCAMGYFLGLLWGGGGGGKGRVSRVSWKKMIAHTTATIMSGKRPQLPLVLTTTSTGGKANPAARFLVPDWGHIVDPALQRHNTKNSKQILPEREFCGHSPNFHIHVSESDLYIPRIGLPTAGNYVE
jgi:hypothetical protein